MTNEKAIVLTVGNRRVAGTVMLPTPFSEGMLFVHGWNGNQTQYGVRAKELSSLGCVCLTFDLYGHAQTFEFQHQATREDNLADIVAAYDYLAGLPNVDHDAIGVVGSSYGGYLAAILTTLRPIRWLALRAPALYRDQDWAQPKASLDRSDLNAYRLLTVPPGENRALAACAVFQGDVLLVESEHDTIVPASVTANYRTSFAQARSLTFRVLENADHALSDMKSQAEYTAVLKKWAIEVVLTARNRAS